MNIFSLNQFSGDVCKEFFTIIKEQNLRTVFQPIVSLRDGNIFGYEALSRGPKNSDLESPSNLFELAEFCDALWSLEFLCRKLAIKRFKQLNINKKLFINISPNIINDNKFKHGFTKNFIVENSINPYDLIFEITERYAVKNISDFKKTIKHYKEQRYNIAIDDVGSGYSGLSLIAEIEPHYIKLDMTLIRDIDKDLTKQAIIKGMVEYSKLTNTKIIAEGIETEEELKTLIDLEINYGQGYFIARPKENVLNISPSVLHIIKKANSSKNKGYGYKISNIYIENIATNTLTVTPKIPLNNVDHIFKNNPNLAGFCVTEGTEILGVVTKRNYYTTLSGRYGYSLYANKSVSFIMNKKFLVVTHDTPINIVAELAMSRCEETLYDFITVTKEGLYCGTVTVKDLIKKAIEVEVNNAKHLNPLTELPGNIMIEKSLNNCLSNHDPSCALYIDIDNFKAYNDVYGFEKGDQIIKVLADILNEIIPNDDFVGHIGGDDFVAVTKCEDPRQMCRDIIKQFECKTIEYYTAEDLKNGYLIAKNRHGIKESFPLLSLSISGVSNKNNIYNTVYELSEKATKLKSECKRHAKSYFIIE